MNLNNNTVACPLDCYDACEAELIKGKIKGSRGHIVTNGKLCINFANLLKEDKLKSARYENKEISLQESLNILVNKLREVTPNKTIFYKGSGNLGVMQSVTKNFFTQYGSVLTKGSLCDGGGGLGIEQGRGKCINPPIQNLINSDVIVVWGRNFTVTSSHMYNLVKDKTFITIDPIKTKIAKKSKLFMQINPKTDYELALMLTRLTYMNHLDDEEYLSQNTKGYEWFFDIAKNRPLVSYEETTGISLDEVYEFFDLIKNKKVSFVLGLGVQKYFEGAQIVRVIDSFTTFLGINKDKSSGGVWYLSDSAYGYEKPFAIKSNNEKISVAKIDFSLYDLVFIQGANPVVSSPNTQKIIDGLKNTFVVFFGTKENETSKYANLIIPSSSFLQKQDFRLSYGHEYKVFSNIVSKKDDNSISEYDLATYLIEQFSFFRLKSEYEIMEYYKNHKPIIDDVHNFEFIEELDIEPLYKYKSEDEFYLITAKHKNSLNSQFAKDDFVYLNPKSGYKDEDEVKISSKYGNAKFIVKLNEDIKDNCAFFFSGNKKVNYLTPFDEDEESYSAMFQEVILKITK